MTREKIRRWSLDTNGEADKLSEESIDEIVEFMDVDEDNNLTCASPPIMKCVDLDLD